jgi:glycosyltransferase involved in cell wall biosynthesis
MKPICNYSDFMVGVQKLNRCSSMSIGRRPRLLILIVAYHAETTVSAVLARIPRGLADLDTEILVLDDGSTDSTFGTASAACDELRSIFPINVLRNPINQGYGGNQKIGYHYAIAHGFDFVALLHGDGQYAPEQLPRLLQPLLSGQAAAVFGSRMMQGRAAVRGGMPIYKFVGNRILTFLQNRLTSSSLSEFHSGYRLYSVQALRSINFHLNTSDFHFDTEIILQFLSSGQRIVELPIPTYYGDEICRVNGIKYACNVLAATVRWRAQRFGICYDAKYSLPSSDSNYQSKLGFASTHRWVIDAIPPGVTVLDIGCSDGHVAKALVAKGCRVIGIDSAPPPDLAPFARFFKCDLEGGLPDPEEDVDYVLALDVIEHLRSPERLAAEVHLLSSRNRDLRLVISTGNIGFFVIRLMLLLGHFNYGPRGILDLTHTRLFTFRSMRRLLLANAFAVEQTVGIPAPFPLALRWNGLASLLLTLNQALIRLSKCLFSYQMLVVCRPLPALDWLLNDAIEASAQQRGRLGMKVGAHAGARHSASPRRVVVASADTA